MDMLSQRDLCTKLYVGCLCDRKFPCRIPPSTFLDVQISSVTMFHYRISVSASSDVLFILTVCMSTANVSWYQVDSLWNADLFSNIDVRVTPHGRFIINDQVSVGVKKHCRETVWLLVRDTGLREVAFLAFESVLSQESGPDSLVRTLRCLRTWSCIVRVARQGWVNLHCGRSCWGRGPRLVQPELNSQD